MIVCDALTLDELPVRQDRPKAENSIAIPSGRRKKAGTTVTFSKPLRYRKKIPRSDKVWEWRLKIRTA